MRSRAQLHLSPLSRAGRKIPDWVQRSGTDPQQQRRRARKMSAGGSGGVLAGFDSEWPIFNTTMFFAA